MKPIFDRYGVQVVAISKDSPEDVARHKREDALSLTLLSDSEFKVIKQYGLLHRKGLEFEIYLPHLLPIGVITGFKDMALPTSLLVDAEGRLRWIDQSEDYRLRSDRSTLETALETHLQRPAA